VVRPRLVGIRADTARAEPRAGSVRRAKVEGCANNRYIRGPIGEHLHIGNKGTLREGQRATEDVAEFQLLAIPGR
jgi:hypothetical protein